MTVLVKKITVDPKCNETVTVECLPAALGKGKSSRYCDINTNQTRVKVGPRCNDRVRITTTIVARPKAGQGDVRKTTKFTRTWSVKAKPNVPCGANG